MATEKAVSPLEKQFQEVAKVTPKKGEDRDEYLGRLAKGLSAASDDDWASLGSAGQQFAETGLIIPFRDKKPFLPFPDAASDDSESEDKSTNGTGAAAPDAGDGAGDDKKEDSTVASGKKKQAASKGKGKKPAANKAPAEKAPAKKKGAPPKKDGKIKAVWKLIAAKPGDSIEALANKVKAKGIDMPVGTLRQARGAFVHVAVFMADNDVNPKDIAKAVNGE